MNIRRYCENNGHRVSGRLALCANTLGVRTYRDEANVAYKVDTITGEISICQRRKESGKEKGIQNY